MEEAAEEEVASFDDHRLRCGVAKVRVMLVSYQPVTLRVSPFVVDSLGSQHAFQKGLVSKTTILQILFNKRILNVI